MSKQQQQTRITQQRNVLKTATGATTKGTTLSNPVKTTNETKKVNSQLRTKLAATTKISNPSLEEKLKFKNNTQRRLVDQATASKARTPREVVNPVTTKPTTKPTTPKYIPKVLTNRNVPSTKKPISTTPKKNDISGVQPMRAKHNLNISEETKKRPPTAVKPNAVLDTYHNVTVSSPPPRRKDINAEPIIETVFRVETEEVPIRVRTHSLEEEDIIILRSDSAKRRIEQQILTDDAPKFSASNQETNIFDVDAIELLTQKPVVKEPVAFEVDFEKPLVNKSISKSRDVFAARNATNRIQAMPVSTEPDNYSDDFESYESDFETASSTQNETESDTSPNSASSADSEDEKGSKSDNSFSLQGKEEAEKYANSSEEEEESELTQNPVTIIQRDKEIERKLDSGNYHMNSRKYPKLSEINTQINEKASDSMDTSYSVALSDQLDSGISGYTIVNNAQGEVDKFDGSVCTYGGYSAFNSNPILSKRGKELMSKIQFDTLTFSLFELKPISYEVYMQTYGTLNTTQCSTQTNDNCMSSECQTDKFDMRTMWTQHPSQYDLQTVERLGAGLSGMTAIQNCCGEVPFGDSSMNSTQKTDFYDKSLRELAAFRQSNNSRILNQQLKCVQKPVDFERLNSFMMRASYIMSKVLNSAQNAKEQEHLIKLNQNQRSLRQISEGYMELETNFLNALRVVRIFSSAKHDLIITVHASPPESEVYRSDFSNLLMVWHISEISKPLRLLSTWSEICRAEICYDNADVIVCGLRDGSIAMWDLCETYSFCSKLDGYLKHFPPTQSVVPTLAGIADQSHGKVHFGSVVDVRSFRTPSKAIALGTYKSIQFAALNDTGILSIWTLVETSMNSFELNTPGPSDTHHQAKHNSENIFNSRFEYSSPWARVKLIQSAICDLRVYLERGLRRSQTQFEKTKHIFQKEIYNDEALRELNSTLTIQKQSQKLNGIRFTGIDTGCERIYVCTNHNFILSCSKSLKSERFRKININEDCLLFPTALQVLTNENFLAVGLSNGSVLVVNCNPKKMPRQRNAATSRLHTANTFNNVPTMISTSATPDIDPDTGKSCAIQNIILNERRLLTGNSFAPNYDMRPSTAAYVALIDNQKRPFEIRVYDQQIILSGSALRKGLVKSLELSSDGWRLFALVNGHIRIYDFYLDREISNAIFDENEKQVMDISVAKSSQMMNHLMILEEGNEVQVHLLKQ